MLILANLVLIAAVAYAMAVEGLAESVIVFLITLLSGFFALAIHQYVADFFAAKLAGSMAENTEDAISFAPLQ